MINLYTNYKSTGKWDKQGANPNNVMVALAKALKQERVKNKNIPGNYTIIATNTPDTEPGNYTVPPAWKFKNVRKTTTCPDTGAKYDWCKIHVRKK